jgi:DNA-binding XRE family transcriptional regulator
MHTCPDCRGKKSAFGLACSDKGCRPITMICRFCNGTGVVGTPAFKRWRIGEAMRRARVKRGSSQREQASLLGISQSVLNDIEHGRADAPLCAKCQDRRRAPILGGDEEEACEWCLVPWAMPDN